MCVLISPSELAVGSSRYSELALLARAVVWFTFVV